ncbi:MAG: DUF402 domain-containing protein [Anaerolineae bacterium]
MATARHCSVQVTKEDHQGCPKARYTCALVHQDAASTVLRCTWTMHPVDVGLFRFEPGDVLTEYYYREAWYNVFRVESPDGTLKGWYCNLTEPAEIAPGEIRWRDLALDLLALPDGRTIVADEEEFEALLPSDALRARAQEVLADLRGRLVAAAPPFERPKQPVSVQ